MVLENRCCKCNMEYKFSWNFCPRCGKQRGFKQEIPKDLTLEEARAAIGTDEEFWFSDGKEQFKSPLAGYYKDYTHKYISKINGTNWLHCSREKPLLDNAV